jgi:adenosylcobinamide-phosphate synthase
MTPIPRLLLAAPMSGSGKTTLMAPLLAYALGGLPGACAYRAVNTLDAMVGYRGHYEYLGKVPARLDDLLNLVPAGLTGLLIVGAAGLCGADAPQAWRVMWRDHAATDSPNAGYPMAAMAGALGVRLEKAGHYCLNTQGREPTADDLRRASWVVGVGVGGASLLAGVLISRRSQQ